jgi:hypothetical protein
VSLLAIWLARRPRGYPKATSIAALVNAGCLLMLNVAIAVAAVQHSQERVERQRSESRATRRPQAGALLTAILVGLRLGVPGGWPFPSARRGRHDRLGHGPAGGVDARDRGGQS